MNDNDENMDLTKDAESSGDQAMPETDSTNHRHRRSSNLKMHSNHKSRLRENADPYEEQLAEIKKRLIADAGLTLEISAERWNDETQEYEALGGPPLSINTQEGNFNMPMILRRANAKWGSGKYKLSFYLGDKLFFSITKSIINSQSAEEQPSMNADIADPIHLSELNLTHGDQLSIQNRNDEQASMHHASPITGERGASSMTENRNAVSALFGITEKLLGQFNDLLKTLSGMEYRMVSIEAMLKDNMQNVPKSAGEVTNDGMNKDTAALQNMTAIIGSLMSHLREFMPRQQPVQSVQSSQNNLLETLAVLERLGIKFNNASGKEMEWFMRGLDLGKTGRIDESDVTDEEPQSQPKSSLETLADKVINAAAPKLGDAIGNMIANAMIPQGPTHGAQGPAIPADMRKNIIDAVATFTPAQLADLIRQQFNEEQLRAALQQNVDNAVSLFIAQFPETARNKAKLTTALELIKESFDKK